MFTPKYFNEYLISAVLFFVCNQSYSAEPAPLASKPLTSHGTSSIALSSFNISEGDAQVYFSLFDEVDWSGDLLAYDINSDGSLDDLRWSASDRLDTRVDIDTHSSRTILSYADNAGVPFDSDLATDTLTVDHINYLRGDKSNEGTEESDFRIRNHLLGDIINSSPIYVGAPVMFYPDQKPFGSNGDRYSNFRSLKNERTAVVYVGANDGMLHGFNATTGEEALAYVPNSISPFLSELTAQNYQHRYYVDQTPTIADAYLDDCGDEATCWKTILVGGLGAGGRGLFALDITNPSNFSQRNADDIVLWEFSADDDLANQADKKSDLGYTLAQPVIGLTESGRWAAFVGNGYHPESGIAKLFIIYLDANPSDSNGWEGNGVDYEIVSTETGGNSSSNSFNGLFSPTAVDSDGNGKIDRIYAGDIKGNLWVFKYDSESGWIVAYDSNPLFSAGNTQPITAKPTVIRHPTQPITTESAPNLLVLFGTGQLLTDDDPDNTATQSFYAIWDHGTANLNRANLTKQSIISSGFDLSLDVETRLTNSATTVPYNNVSSNTRHGWYLDLENEAGTHTGERIIAEAMTHENIVFFVTYTPTEDRKGSSWFMTLSVDNGGPPTRPIVKYFRSSIEIASEDNDASLPSGLRTEGTLGRIKTGNSAVILKKSEETEDLIHFNTSYSNETSPGKRLSWKEIRPD